MNTGYLTEVFTATLKGSDGAPSATTTGPPLVTATVVDGSLNIFLAPGLMDKLTKIAETIPACAAKKRSGLCDWRAFQQAAQDVEAGIDIELLEAQLQGSIIEAMGWVVDGTVSFIQLLTPATMAELYTALRAAGILAAGAFTVSQFLPVVFNIIKTGAATAGGVAFATDAVSASKTAVQTVKDEQNTCSKTREKSVRAPKAVTASIMVAKTVVLAKMWW